VAMPLIANCQNAIYKKNHGTSELSPLATSPLGEGWGEVGDDPPAGGGGVSYIYITNCSC